MSLHKVTVLSHSHLPLILLGELVDYDESFQLVDRIDLPQVLPGLEHLRVVPAHSLEGLCILFLLRFAA